jgi:carbamoyltransferase
MYDAVSELIGLSSLEAGKTMGLAAHGRARGIEPWPMMQVAEGSVAPPFSLPPNAPQKQIAYAWWDHIRALGFRRGAGDSYSLDSDDAAVRLAWSAQASLERAMTTLADRARRVTGESALCLAGGVALNCSANGLLPQPVYAPPVPHDAGVALGAAWAVAPPRRRGQPLTPYLGRSLSGREIDEAVGASGLSPRQVAPDDLARRLLEGQIGAVVTGRAEIGPRALGHRSILAAAHDEKMRDRLNLLKGRELWRPLSPIGLPACEDTYWAGNPTLHRYMVGASPVTDRGRAQAPVVTHVDGTARPQIVSDSNELVWAILAGLASAGAPPIAVNTSFNTRGEPIVDDAHGAIGSARAIGLDFLVLEDRLLDFASRG